ncbi:5335_t:CDS:2, partial [Scutellospora calospora]
SQRSNAKTVVDFVENLYGIQKVRSTLSKENSEQLTFHAGLIQDIKNSNYFYVRKRNNTFHSPYNLTHIKLKNKIQLEISKMVEKLVLKHNIEILSQYYLVNIHLEECTYLDFIWNGSFHNICKHCHAT